MPLARLPIVALHDIQSQCADRLPVSSFHVHSFCSRSLNNSFFDFVLTFVNCQRVNV